MWRDMDDLNSGSSNGNNNLVPVEFQSRLERKLEERKRRRRLDLKSVNGVERERIRVYREYSERMEKCRTQAERREASRELHDRNAFLKDHVPLVTEKQRLQQVREYQQLQAQQPGNERAAIEPWLHPEQQQPEGVR